MNIDQRDGFAFAEPIMFSRIVDRVATRPDALITLLTKPKGGVANAIII
jgi:hypothetical protein